MESFATYINGQKPFTIFAKCSILDTCGGPEYTSLITDSFENCSFYKFNKRDNKNSPSSSKQSFPNGMVMEYCKGFESTNKYSRNGETIWNIMKGWFLRFIQPHYLPIHAHLPTTMNLLRLRKCCFQATVLLHNGQSDFTKIH